MSHSVFFKRRQALFDALEDNSVVLVASGRQQYRNADTEFPFRQESHFYYLTGFHESMSVLVLQKKQGKQRFILFCLDKDKQAECWTGKRAGVEGAIERFGADEAYSVTQLDKKMLELIKGAQTIYYLVNANAGFERSLFSWVNALSEKIRSGVEAPHRFVDLRVILDEQRLLKSEEEIVLIKKACEISTNAHCEAMARCHPGMFEYELDAILTYEFMKQGCHASAYPSIVAGGEHACILHYTQNNAPIKEHSLVLIDAGAEYCYYAADITRTFPANGTFSAPQQAIYEIVLEAQTQAIASLKVGMPWNTIQSVVLKYLVQGLVDLNILSGNVDTLIEEKAYFPFYMHNSGHWLGMDVHDVGEYKIKGKWRPLKPNMVFTVEPGLYISPDCDTVPEAYRGIGVRIEDDILMTSKGALNLTAGVPKQVSEIEQCVGKKA